MLFNDGMVVCLPFYTNFQAVCQILGSEFILAMIFCHCCLLDSFISCGIVFISLFRCCLAVLKLVFWFRTILLRMCCGKSDIVSSVRYGYVRRFNDVCVSQFYIAGGCDDHGVIDVATDDCTI